MTRRWFLSMVLAALAPLGWIVPSTWSEALRGRVYPGPVHPLDKEAIKTPGRWAG